MLNTDRPVVRLCSAPWHKIAPPLTQELKRVRGGTLTPPAEVKPIVFSQAELARRSMEPIPSVSLLDIHCPQSIVHNQEIEELENEVRCTFNEAVKLAKQAHELRLEVDNEQEGLEATRFAFSSLVGNESTAKSLGDLGRIEDWHKNTRRRLDEWHGSFQIPAGPELPNTPRLETELPIEDYLPSCAILRALDEYRTAISNAADGLIKALRLESEKFSPSIETLRSDIQARLGCGQVASQELAGEAETYRTRLSKLEQQATDLGML